MATDEREVIPISNGGLTWTKLITLLLTVIVGTMGSNVVLRVADPPRPDPFTSKDAQMMRLEMEREAQSAVSKIEDELRAEMQAMRRTIPPQQVRQRIRSVEKFLEKDGYKLPTEEWNDWN